MWLDEGYSISVVRRYVLNHSLKHVLKQLLKHSQALRSETQGFKTCFNVLAPDPGIQNMF